MYRKVDRTARNAPALVTRVDSIRDDTGQILLKSTVEYLGKELAEAKRQNEVQQAKIASLENVIGVYERSQTLFIAMCQKQIAAPNPGDDSHALAGHVQ